MPDAGNTTDQEPTRPGRITSEARGLVEDVKRWVDLKVQLLQIDLEARLEGVLNRAAQSVVMAVLLLLTVQFGLFTVAFSLASWWYSDALGFLAVTLLLAVATVTFYALRPTLVKLRRIDEAEKTPELSVAPRTPELGPPEASNEPDGGSANR